MIFKTFNSDIDKKSSKWAMFGRSFNDIGTAIVGRISDINKGIQATDDLIGSIKNSDSIWKRLYPSKENIKGQLIDVDALYPDMSDTSASKLLSKLQNEQVLVNANKKTWQNYFNGLKEGEKWQIDFVQNTDLQKASLTDVKKAYESARTSALAHNEAIKAQTFSAKAGKVALQTLAMAGNMIAMWAFTKVIQVATTSLDDYIHKVEKTKEAAEGFTNSVKSFSENTASDTTTLSSLNKEYTELSKGVNSLGQNVHLSTEEYDRYKEIISQVSAVMPELGVRYNEQGEKIGFVKGQLSDLNEEYTKYQKNQAKKLLTQGDENGNTLQDVIDNYNNQATNRESIKILKEAVKMSKEELLNSNLLTYQSDILGKRDYDVKKMSDSEYNSFIEGLVSKLETKQAEIDVAVNAYQNSMRTLLVSNDDFYKLAPDYQSALTSMFSSIPENIINAYGLTTEDKIRSFIRKIIFSIKDNEEVSEAFTKILGFDSENATQNSLNELDKYFNTISKAIGVLPNNVKQMFHLDDLEIPTQDITNLLTTAGISKDIAEEVAKGLTTKEIEAVKNADSIDWSKLLNLTGATEVLDFIKNAISNTTNLNEFETQTHSFQSIFDSEDFKNTKEELLKLAKAGELTPYTLSSANEYNTLLEKTGLTAEQVYKKIMKIAHSDMSMGDWSNTLSNARSQIVKTKEAQKELNTNGKSAALVETIISDYPQLLGYLDDEEKLRKQLKALQGEQEDVAAQAYMHLVEDSEVYYSTLKTKESEKLNAVNHTINSIISGNKALVGILGETYMVDLNNYKSIADAKARLETQLIKNSASAWNKFYKIQINANTGLAEVYGSIDAGSPGQFLDETGDYGKAVDKYVEEQRKQKKAAQDSANAYNEAITALEEITKTTQISTDIPAPSKDKGTKTKDSYSKFAQTIDWCVQTITNMINKIELLNSKLNNTKALNKQISYYNSLIKAQQKLIKGYAKEENTYKKAYNKSLNKLSDKDRKKVENGTYTIEDFKDKTKSGKKSEAEKRYNNIQSALEARDTYLKSQTDLVNAKQQLSEYIETLAGIRWEKANESIEKLNKNIEVLDAKASNLNGYKSKNANLDAKVKAQYKIVKEQQSAVNKTQSDKDTIDKKALNTKSKINSKYKTSKRTNADGTLSEKNVTGKQLTLIKQYNLQIKKSNAYKKKLSEINKELAISEQEYITLMNESIVEKANNIQQDYENKLSLIDAKENQLDSQIALAEAKGQIASAKYYELLNQNSKQRISELKAEKKALENQLKGLSEYSDAWYEVKNILLSVDEQLAQETQNAVENISKQIEAVNNLTDAINHNIDLHTGSDFYTSLTDGEDYYDKNGMTDVGKSVLAAKYLEYTGKRQQRESLDKEWEEISRKYLECIITEAEMTQLTDEWLKKAQDIDKEIISSQNAIGDMLAESYKAQLDGLKEIIDAKKKALSLDKSEYDYQKSIAEKTKNIATLQKQLAMLEGRNDEEANAERQKIQLQLEDAQEDLDDTQYDKYIERVENALDDLSERFSNAIDELSKTLNHVETIESNIYDLVSDNRGSIFESIENVFDERGINLNDSGDWFKYMQSLAGNKNKKEDTFGTGIISERLEQQTGYLEKIYEKIPDDEETGKEKTKLSVADVLGKASEENKKADTSKMSALNKYLVSQGYKQMSTSNMADLASALRSSSAFDKLDAKTKETISSITSASQLNSKKDINASANKNALLKALKYTMKYTEIQEFLDSHLEQGNADNNYGTLNRYLYQTQNGKVLSKEDAVTLGKMLGVSDANKNGMIDGKEGKELVEKLKQAGFSSGGIVEAVHQNGDSGLATLKAGESVLTPLQTNAFLELVGKLNPLNNTLDIIQKPNLPNFDRSTYVAPANIENVNFAFNLPNVVDSKSLIKTIQSDTQVQRTLQNATVGKLNGNTRFGVNKL